MASLAACCACSGASCAANALCSCFGMATNHSNKLTRMAYTGIFLAISLATWVWFVWGYDWYKDVFPSSIIHVNCPEEVCFGAFSVYRITMVLAGFYLIHALIAALSRTTKLNTKMWGVKLILLAASIILVFFIPNPVFLVWAWAALVGGTIFLIIQLVLLVEFAHSWSENWTQKWDEDDSKKKWFYGLLISSIALYVGAFALTVAEYSVFTPEEGCGTNAVYITVNLLLCILGSALSLHPSVQEKNPRSGLLQSAVVSCYTSYLIWSALMSQPDNTCNKLTGGKESFSAITGALIAFISVCYSAFRVSTQSDKLAGKTETSPIYDEETARIDDPQPEEEEEEDDGFNYTFFHICFAMASCYVAMLITNWMIVHQSQAETYVIDRSEGSVWVKLVSSWVAHLLYIWSLVAPIILRNRHFYDI